MMKINLKYCLFILAAIWAFLTFFTISWDLPSKYTPEADGITQNLNFSAREMMKADTYKYPPLQYLIVDAVTKNIPEHSLPQHELEKKRSQRIITYRTISALMGFGTVVFLFLAGVYFLNCPPLYSLGASIFFMLLSPVLFYSQSSNMDMPSCFWFTGSIFFAALAEYKYKSREKKKAYFATHFLAGIFIGCAFCTKDQVYAWYILPAMAFWYWKWREHKSFLKTFTSCFLWGIAFLITVSLIYTLISWEVFLPHLYWIIGEGSTPYAVIGKGLWDRTTLIWYSLHHLWQAMDLPLLIMFFIFACIIYKKKEIYKKDVIFIHSAILSFLLLLSQFVFFGQIVRYSHVRYFIPILPFLILLLLHIFKKEMEINNYKKLIVKLVVFLFIFQACIAVNFLYILDNSPLAQLKNELDESLIYKNLRINTAMAQVDARYLQRKDGIQEKRKCIRPWGVFLGLEKYGIKDILIDDLSLFLLDPYIVISNKEISFPENYSYVLVKKYEKKPSFVFSLYKYQDKGSYFLYSKSGQQRNITFPNKGKGFQNDVLEMQIIKLNYLLALHNNFSFMEMSRIGQALAPFTPPDSKTYLINNYMYKVLFDAYNAAGRKEEAAKCRKFYSAMK